MERFTREKGELQTQVRTAQEKLTELKATETIFPGTELRLIYELSGPD